MDLACSEAELERLLASVAFTRNFGFVLAGIGDGQCSVDVPFREEFERPGGVVSGQVFMAAADVAMWLAIKTRLGIDDASVTAEMKTNFLSGREKKASVVHRGSFEAGPAPDLWSRALRGQRRPPADASHGHLYAGRTGLAVRLSFRQKTYCFSAYTSSELPADTAIYCRPLTE